MVAGTKTLGGILDHRDPILGRDTVDAFKVGAKTKEGDRNDRPASRADRRLQ